MKTDKLASEGRVLYPTGVPVACKMLPYMMGADISPLIRDESKKTPLHPGRETRHSLIPFYLHPLVEIEICKIQQGIWIIGFKQ